MFNSSFSRSNLPFNLNHSHSFPVLCRGTLLLPRRVLPKYICGKNIIGLTENSNSLDVAHTYPYRSFVVFSKEQRFKKNEKKLLARYATTYLNNVT